MKIEGLIAVFMIFVAVLFSACDRNEFDFAGRGKKADYPSYSYKPDPAKP